MLILLELSGKDSNMSTTNSWALFRDHVIDLRRPIVVVGHVVISVVLIVQGEINTSDADAVESGWSGASHLGRVDETSGRLHIQI